MEITVQFVCFDDIYYIFIYVYIIYGCESSNPFLRLQVGGCDNTNKRGIALVHLENERGRVGSRLPTRKKGTLHVHERVEPSAAYIYTNSNKPTNMV